jgi:hypothetical protein
MTISGDERSLLARVDERTKSIAEDIAEMKAASAGYVTHAEFAPVRALVFGAVGVILLTFMGALLYVAGFQT